MKILAFKNSKNILPTWLTKHSLKSLILVGLVFFGGSIITRPNPLKFNRGQIADLTYDEHAQAVFSYKMDLAIPHGLIPNMSSINKYGKNPDADSGQDNDIWDLGGTYEFLSAPTVLTLSSATSTDADGDTGARTVKIFTLDDNWAFASQFVTMDGLSGVTLTGQHRRVYRAWVETAGSNNGAQATIHAGFGAITDGIPATTLAAILPVNNQTLMAIMTVPSGVTGYICRWDIGFDGITGTARFGEAIIQTRTNSGVRRIRRIKGLSTDLEAIGDTFHMPIVVEEKQDVIMMVNDLSASNLVASGDFDMVFINN